jgi:hypothetical protein
MHVLAPLLGLSVFATCVSGAKATALIWRHRKGKKFLITDVFLTSILLVLSILLLVFSILRVEIALQVLLSLASGALILFQVSCPGSLRSCANWLFVFSVYVCVELSS